MLTILSNELSFGCRLQNARCITKLVELKMPLSASIFSSVYREEQLPCGKSLLRGWLCVLQCIISFWLQLPLVFLSLRMILCLGPAEEAAGLDGASVTSSFWWNSWTVNSFPAPPLWGKSVSRIPSSSVQAPHDVRQLCLWLPWAGFHMCAIPLQFWSMCSSWNA